MAKEYPYNEKPIKVPSFAESGGYTTTPQRSRIMAKIRGKNTKPELLLRKALWKRNIRFRIHDKSLPGRPDIVIKKYKLAIFVDGEFWHGKNWEQKKEKMQTNRSFWVPKIERNMQKDHLHTTALKDMGYAVFRFWADELMSGPDAFVNQVMLYIETAKEVRIPSQH